MAAPAPSSHSQSITIVGPHPRLDEIVADTFTELGWNCEQGTVGSVIATTPASLPSSSGERIVVELRDADLVMVTSQSDPFEQAAETDRNASNVRTFLEAFKRQIEQRPVTLAKRAAETSEQELGFNYRKHTGVLVLAVYTFGPVLCVVVAGLVATALGCELSEADVQPCKCMGIDIGYPLYALGMIGWVGVLTLPTGIVALLIWSVFSRD